MAPRTEVSKLRADENLIIAEERVDVSLVRGKAPISLAIVVGVVLLAGFNFLPIMVSAILGCVAMALTGCLRLEDAYRDMDWRVLILLAGLLPLGIAMEKSGAARLLVGATSQFLGDATPVTMLAALYFLTAVLTECMSNNAAAVLLAPVAISAAEAMGVSAKPFLMAVTFAASTSFATPVGYQTNTMVYNAGGYRSILLSMWRQVEFTHLISLAVRSLRMVEDGASGEWFTRSKHTNRFGHLP